MSATVGYATLQVIPSVRGIAADLRRQLVGPAEQAGQRAGESSGGGFREAFQGALAALGVQALAEKAGEAFAETFGEALEQGNITSRLKAQLGATPQQAQQYGKLAGKLYSSAVSDSFEDAAEVIRDVAQAGLLPPGATNKQLESIATKASDVAGTFGADFEGVTNAASRLIATGLVKNAGEAFDLITVGYQKLGPKADDLLDTFNEYSVQFQKMGLSGTTSLGLIDQGIKAGARDTDLIADAIKEFSIRSIDGSATTIAGFKGLGLSAKGMAKQIAKGGTDAAAGLDTVLDRLRKVPDPVKRSQLAVDLFGTQAEDLGAALFALDPSKAVKTIGDVGGAATQVGKDIRSGPSYEITVFKRQIQQGLVNFLGNKVIPILSRWGKTFDEDVLPPLAAVGGVLNRDFLPAVHGAADIVVATVGWFKEWGVWLLPLAVLIGGVTLALSAEAIAVGAVNIVFGIYRGVILAATAITEGFAGAQAFLNTVMEANPIILIVTAVLALALAFYIAYKKSDTFRSIVQGAWEGIQAAAETAWKTVLKPTIDALMKGWQAISDGAVWLWQNVLQPFFNFVMPVLKILATIVGVTLYVAFQIWWTGTKLYIDAIVLLIQGLAAVGVWLYKVVLKPVIDLIIWNFKLWWAAAKLYINANIVVFQALATVALWLWKSVVKPTVGFIVGAYHATGDAAKWLWTSAISPAFHAIGVLAQWLYDKGLKPPLDKGKQLAKDFGGAFKSAAGVIGTEFGKVSDFAKKPIAFVIDTVYNKGLVGVWNKVAGAFGAPKLGTFKGFATGGAVFGAGSETSDSVPAWLSNGEHVWTAAEVRGAGGHDAVGQLRAWAAAGGFRNGTPGLKHGGPFGWVGSAANAVSGAGSASWNLAKKGASWLKDTLAASARAGVRAVVNPLLNKIPGLDTPYGKMIKAVPQHMIDVLFGFADKADKEGASSSTAGGHHASPSQAQSIARKMLGKFGFGAGQMGPLLKLWTGESGWRWNAENKSSGAYGIPQSLPASKMAAAGKDWHDNAATQIKWGLDYIKGRYGDPATAYGSWLSHSPHWYDNGGQLRPGLTLAANGTRKPEAILTDSQWATAAAAIARTTAAAQAPAGGRTSERDLADALAGLTVLVQVGDEPIAAVARTELRKANGELIAVLNAGGGQ